MAMDWGSLFELSVPPLELVVRGSVIYWFLFLLFRVVVRRDAGSIAIADILFLVIIADAAQNALAGDYRSITDGMILISTIVAWNYAFDWMAYHWDWADRLLKPARLCLVRDGRIQWENLHRELMSREELMTKLREHEIDTVAKVKIAYMESDGKISVIRKS